MTAELQPRVDEAVRRIRDIGTDLRTIEVKAAEGGLPRSVKESVSAFANTGGGMVILGLRDGDFLPVSIDAVKLAGDLASTCAADLDPPVRPDIDIAEVDGHPVVVALVDELPPGRKPCYVRNRGLDGGSYVRTHDGDRRLNSYEVHVLVSGRGQPLDDVAVVERAQRSDLDGDLLSALLSRIRRRRGPALAAASDDDILRMLNVIVGEGPEPSVTLAGLLSLGRYPQQFVAQLNVTFVAFPTVTGHPLDDGTRFLDNESIDGPIPTMVATAQAAVRRNITRRAVVTGAGRLDVWEYPNEAVREIVVNAVLHRDYHPVAHGTQVRIELYPDRLRVTNPGGLHGDINRERLFTEPVTSSRNSHLAKLLEDIEVPHTGRTVCENRGSGLLAVARELRSAGLAPPEFTDRVSDTTMTIHGDDYRIQRPERADPAATPPEPRTRIRALLSGGPVRTRVLADELGVTPQGALRQLRQMEDAGEIELTESTRRSPLNRWRLTTPPGND